MPLLPLLERVESRFDAANSIKWCGEHWKVALYACAAYLLVVFTGRRWMQNRPAYSLRLPLTMWNAGLASFSALGSMALLPSLIEVLSTGGLRESVCINVWFSQSHVAIWIFFFVLSKIAELGDTIFIVLRKSPLSFLHWYHHITVLCYGWISYALIPPNAIAIWFSLLNYIAHTAMYSYYAVRACGRKLPVSISQCITVLQLSQFVISIFCVCMGFWYKNSPGGEDCAMHDNVFYFGMLMYGSYFILFVNFFYHRYIR